MNAEPNLMERLTALCKRRGFIFPGSEIYGGLGGFWDYGPLGVELKRNIKELWWRDMVQNPPIGPDGEEVSMVGVDCAIIMNPKVWEASGHVGGFADPMVDCKECKARFRADKVFSLPAFSDKSKERLKDFIDFIQKHGSAIKVQSLTLHTSITATVEADGADEAMKYAEEAFRSIARDTNKEAFKKCKLHVFQTGPSHDPNAYILEDKTGHCYWVFPGSLANSTLSPGHKIPCPRCRAIGSLTEPRLFNLMFKTYVGALEDASSVAYLRPETAQGIFVNYKNVLDTSRVKTPFGIAQTGKSFRNEINPRNYTFRSREFEQMEIEFFCAEEDSMKWYEFWRKTRYNWYVNLGLKSEKLRLRDQGEKELAHYSKACADIEYLFPFSDEHQELEGVAHRGQYDLGQHQKFSGRDMSFFDDEAWQAFLAKRKADGLPDLTKEEKTELSSKAPYRYVPTVIEPSAGADRATLAFLCEAYCEDEAPNDKGQMEKRVVMRFHPRIAPIKAAFFPLVGKEGMPELAHKLYREAKKTLNVFYDDKGAIGRRYRRQDEAGTPYCITIDGKTISTDASDPEAGTVTIRDRDSLKQDRVKCADVVAWLTERVR